MADIILKDPKQLLLGAELASASLSIDFGASGSGVYIAPALTSFASESCVTGAVGAISN